jgi:hypothetical protein
LPDPFLHFFGRFFSKCDRKDILTTGFALAQNMDITLHQNPGFP